MRFRGAGRIASGLVPTVGVACLGLFSLLLTAGSCPPTRPEQGRIDPAELPTDPLELLQLAERMARPENSFVEKQDALVVLDVAEQRGSNPYVTQILRARTLFRLIEENEGDVRRLDWVTRGVAAAEAAVRLNPDRAEGHYFLATLLGRQAENSAVGAMDAIPRIQEAAERALELDRTLDNCGPLVALGMLYVAAPPWPQSIGDPELGIDYLRQAVECSDFPVNRILLAEALLDQGEFEEAKRLLRWVLARPGEGVWGVVGNRWRPIARDLLNRAEHPTIE